MKCELSITKTRIVWIALLVVVLLLTVGCGTEEVEHGNDQGFFTTDEECFPIETKFCALEFPEKWKEITKTEIVDGDPYTVKFFCVTSAGDIPLFDLNFNGGNGFALGSLTVDGKKVPIYLDSFDVDQDALQEDEYYNFCAMQEDVNVLISRLIENNGFILSGNEPISEQAEEKEEVFAIQTKYGKLSYPKKWKELSEIEIVESPVYTVKFTGKTSVGDVPLFALTFNGGEGYCLGSMTIDGQTVTIYIDDYMFQQGNMSEEEYFNCCAMQEDVNLILEHLIADYGFSFNI